LRRHFQTTLTRPARSCPRTRIGVEAARENLQPKKRFECVRLGAKICNSATPAQLRFPRLRPAFALGVTGDSVQTFNNFISPRPPLFVHYLFQTLLAVGIVRSFLTFRRISGAFARDFRVLGRSDGRQ
jgi:hypothetical protein